MALFHLPVAAERKEMGEPNNVLKEYMGRQDRIRSVLEYYLGEKLPEDWKCEEIGGFYTVRNAGGKVSFRQRDYIGQAQAWGSCFLLGIENQETANLVYPWRLMEMDCLAYGRAIEDIQEKNTRSRASYGREDDFKYRYLKGDRLEPVLNLALYWGRKPWKGPLSLREMLGGMEVLPERLRRLSGDYRVHMIHMRAIPEGELEKMDSDLKYVLGIMKCTRSKKRYEEYIRKNREYFSHIPRSAADVIDVCTHIGGIRRCLEFTYNPESGEEEADMCKALNDILKDARNKGIKQGRAEGRKQGKEEGLAEGTFLALCSLVRDGLLGLEEASKRASLTEAVFSEKMRKAGYGPS